MVVTKAELAANDELSKYAFKIVKEILAMNDKALVANLLDFSKKIIVDAMNIKELITLAIPDSEVEIETDIESRNCDCKCCKVKTSLYETIESINVNGKDIFETEKELCKYISDELGISLDKTYASQVFKIEKKAVVETYEESEEVEEDASS